MKKVFCVVGAVLIVGAMAVAFYLYRKTKEHGTGHGYKDTDGECAPEDNESLSEVTIVQDDPIYENVKNSAIGNMYSRHEDAATIMSSSVDAIRENIKVSENTNNEINEISAELDKMISED